MGVMSDYQRNLNTLILIATIEMLEDDVKKAKQTIEYLKKKS
jgi:hypothetical protein